MKRLLFAAIVAATFFMPVKAGTQRARCLYMYGAFLPCPLQAIPGSEYCKDHDKEMNPKTPKKPDNP